MTIRRSRTRPPFGRRLSVTHLNGQTQGVEDDEDEHDVLEARGVDHVPELVLVGVLGDVAPQGPGFEGVLHALTLPWRKQRAHYFFKSHRKKNKTAHLEEEVYKVRFVLSL